MIVDGPIQLDSVMFDILDAVGKGFSATEIMWDRSGREWFPVELKWRDPRWFAFDWISGEQMLVRTLKGETEVAPASVETRPRHFGGGIPGSTTSGIRMASDVTAQLAAIQVIVRIYEGRNRDCRRVLGVILARRMSAIFKRLAYSRTG